MKLFVGPNIKVATITTTGFSQIFSQIIFLVQKLDSINNNQGNPPKGRKWEHSVDSSTPDSQKQLNLLHRKFETFCENSPPLYTLTTTKEKPQL